MSRYAVLSVAYLRPVVQLGFRDIRVGLSMIDGSEWNPRTTSLANSLHLAQRPAKPTCRCEDVVVCLRVRTSDLYLRASVWLKPFQPLPL